MYLTREFQRAVIGLFLLALLMAGVSIILTINNLYGLSVSSQNSISRVITSQSLNFIEIIALWVTIAYITRDRKGALVALSIQMIMMIFTVYFYITRGVTEDTIQALQWPKLLVQLFSYTVFGLIHFKRQSGFLMVLVAVVFTGISAGFNTSGFYRFLNNLFHIIDWDNFMQLEIRKDLNTTRRINLFSLIISNLYLPLRLLVFWFIYTKIKFPQSFNKTLSIIPVTGYISQTSFSVIYWVLRLSLFVIAMGIIGSLLNINQNETYYSMYVLICFCLAVYVVGSMYRNFLVAYFISKGRHPSWLYLLLQIPVLHIFGWIITFLFKPKPLPEPKYVMIDPEPPAISTSPAMARLAQAKEDHEYSAKNTVIKVLIIVMLLLMWVIPNELAGFDGGATRIIGIINFCLSLWYFFDRKALLPLFIIQSVAVLILYLTRKEEMMQPILTFSLVNMVVYYALFHFTNLEFIEDDGVKPTS